MKQHLVAILAVVALSAVVGCGTSSWQEGSDAAPSPSSSTVSPTTTVSPSPSPSDSATSQSPTPKAKERVYWEDLEPGMCVIVPESDSATTVTVVPCRTKHREEVMLRATLPGTTTWPGDDAVDKAAWGRCKAAFGRYVGIDYDSSRLELSYFTTDREGWADGDRTLICFVSDPEHEQLTKSLKGSER